jgi:hypothetical protein
MGRFRAKFDRENHDKPPWDLYTVDGFRDAVPYFHKTILLSLES